MARKDHRIIIHFDYDCFYASVFENENPALKSLPLAVQQKQIIVTCNYEARRRGLSKLQLISEAKKICPDVVIVLGEELGRFRDASKMLYKHLEKFSWSGKVERLGFDEVFMDVTDIVDYNQKLLNPNDLTHSFLQLDHNDPTAGFTFDATRVAGHGYLDLQPGGEVSSQYLSNSAALNSDTDLLTRLLLGSHLAQYLRLSLEEEKGYTSTVGISTNKLLSKLVGNLHKPKGQTTLLPPYDVSSNDDGLQSNVATFIDGHDIGKIPGIGFKMSQRIRNHVLSRPADFESGLIYGGTKESVTVRDVRLFAGMGPDTLENILGGSGAERGIGRKVWGLINGRDDTDVKDARKVPSQISIEDSYIKLDNLSQLMEELRMLTTSLLNRMYQDLLEDDEESDVPSKRWIAYPKTIRLSTRPRLPLNADGTRTRSFNRISRSGPLPNLVFNLKDGMDSIVERLIRDTLVPMFRKLHPQRSDWNLSLVNIGVTNMVEAATEDGSGGGRNIGLMFKRQEATLKEWKVEDRDVPPDFVTNRREKSTSEPIETEHIPNPTTGSEDVVYISQDTADEQDPWEDEDELCGREICHVCGAVMPAFAVPAHQRFHNLEE
ncbi:9634a307-eff2-492c-88f0-29647a4367b5 [Sclerotinia trifoliorum]|uniref:9634a307-eff2-492c-88f0-29647a4367b5 n=1 Tax=Sclerotinia trifoliorum TaxID=28548 RepID=A0A8H2VQF8_9HELO|nr:9634a307-eff2-492c-88f0-29647a4367b5 [Sclerotinia trifoliorum]